jgi:hypothetical protein
LRPFRESLHLWRDCPGGINSDGTVVSKPHELDEAQLILRLCREFHALPSAVLAEDIYLLRLLAIEREGGNGERDRDSGNVEEPDGSWL